MARVYLAVGHGERDNGLFDPGAAAGEWTEQRAGDPIVDEAAKRLRAAGIEVYSEAYTDDPNFPGTTRAANRWRADYVVSIHHDWSRAPRGAFGHWISRRGRRLADAIQRAVGDAGYTLRPSWHKRRRDLYLLRHTRAPAVLYEVGRIGQDDLDSEDELRAMGRAVAAGIAAHLGIELDDEPAPKPDPEPEPDTADDWIDEMRLLKVKHDMLRGEDVEAVQALLDHHGHDIGSAGVDGWYGGDTEEAVRAFQRAEGLTVDGIVGPQTRAALMGA